MADPFAARWGLSLGSATPYTDYPDGYDPTDALAVYSLPKNDPADLIFTPPSPAPQDQSAALFDPSTFAPPPDLGTLAPPTMTVTVLGHSFDVPVGTNFHNEYRAGQYIGAEPIWKQFNDIGNAVGYRGTFDYQRMDGPFNPDYRDASNFGVGVLMRGASYSLPTTDAISSLYALFHGRPDVIPHDLPLWGAGYDAAASGQLPKGEGR